MSAFEKDDLPMLSATKSQMNADEESNFQGFSSRTQSVSMSIPMRSTESYENESNLVCHNGSSLKEKSIAFVQMSGPMYVGRKYENLFQSTQPSVGQTAESVDERYSEFNGVNHNDWPDNSYSGKNEHLLKSGQLGICNDPYCTTCPTYCHANGQQNKSKKTPAFFDPKLHNIFYGGAKGWTRRCFSFLDRHIPGVMNPHAKVVQKWNKFFLISCLVAVFLDPLFVFLLSVQKENKCIVINWTMTTTIVVFRSITDLVYLMHMILQFRLAYVAPESRVVGAGDLVDHPKKIALNYLSGYFLIDFFVVLPLPQVIILLILPKFVGANYAKNILRAAILLQYVPRLYRFLPLLAGQTPSGFTFESAWANFVINLLTFVLAGHVVGSCWYLFGLQRVNQCLREACHDSGMKNCTKFIDCGHGKHYGDFKVDSTWNKWKNNDKAIACFGQGNFSYGIYVNAVNLVTEQSVITRYVFSLFWGFQQISTLAGSQNPSYFIWEVLFTMAIIGLGLLLFALLIGNMQNFLQSLGRRRLEMSLRRRDVEQWMSHRRLPQGLKRQVRLAERYNWAATRGVDEQLLMENLPEDLQRDIRRHLFKFVKKVRIFSLMDEPILDAICERLRHTTYIQGSIVLYPGGVIDKMVFVIRGTIESTAGDGNTVPLFEGHFCGEELLTWCLEHYSINKDERKIKIQRNRLLSDRTVRCLTNVEAFTLRDQDIEDVTSLFARFLRNPRVQGAIRYQSPYWQGLAATRIQVAWRYNKKRLARAEAPAAQSSSY